MLYGALILQNAPLYSLFLDLTRVYGFVVTEYILSEVNVTLLDIVYKPGPYEIHFIFF